MDNQKELQQISKRCIKKYKKALDTARKLEAEAIHLKNRNITILSRIEERWNKEAREERLRKKLSIIVPAGVCAVIGIVVGVILATSSVGKSTGVYRDSSYQSVPDTGQGTYTWSNGNKYVGEWKGDNMHGQGTYTWPNGDKYVGVWKDGRETGGWYYWADGGKKWSYTDSAGNWVDN